jgi:outer membrane protein
MKKTCHEAMKWSATKPRSHDGFLLRAFVPSWPHRAFVPSWPILHVIVAAVFLVSFVADARGQDVLRLTLEDAQARAQQASHRLAELQARETAANAAADIRAAADKPHVAFLAGYTRTNHVEEFVVPALAGTAPRVLYPDIPDNWRTRIDLQWPIYTGGRTDALERAARAEAAASGADLAAARADLRLEVARSFWALVTARSSVGVLEGAVERAQAHVNDVRQRLSAGIVPPNEVASAEAQESRQRMLLIDARNQRDVAASDLARLIGEDVLRPIEPADALESGFAAHTELQAAVAEALTGRSERRAFEQRIEAAEERRTAAAAGARPVISVGGGFDYARPNPRIFPRAGRWDDSWDASINLTWSLWDGGRTNAEVAEAVATATAVRQRLAEFDSVLALDVRHRLLEIESGRAAIAAASDAVRSAEEARRVVAERFAAGVVTHTEVLDAQLVLLQAELDRTRALAGVRLAEARLARATGR